MFGEKRTPVQKPSLVIMVPKLGYLCIITEMFFRSSTYIVHTPVRYKPSMPWTIFLPGLFIGLDPVSFPMRSDPKQQLKVYRVHSTRWRNTSLKSSRVTGWVCKKIAQSVAQPGFWLKIYITCLVEKGTPRIHATYLIF
jgi:hypothetical protein